MKIQSEMIRHIFVVIALITSAMLFGCAGETKQDKPVSQGEALMPTAAAAEQEPGAIMNNERADEPKSTAVHQGKVIQMTTADFKKKVFNYDKNPDEWVFEGERPCIVDFYADWCRPCKLVAPIMDELAAKYAGQIDIYKVNTDHERELSQVFGIRSIPSMLFCPAEGKPQMTAGALPKETYEEVIQNFLLGKGAAQSF